ncbi:putative disease resistance protein RGA3 [Carya illinoinensis]|uniref:putative disease resistance protein RGA3 n=1 Tax=Carya illinoinensis TaxID=32201 RepID=UPI001C721C2F|nr:putative disease resistance protein RGA3 [Carya illinoinensis]
MAEGILFDIAARIIESFGSRALKEIGLFWGATADQLEKLKNTVSTIQAVLLHAEEQGSVNGEVRDWLEKLEDVVYDADDLMDAFSTDYLLREMKMAKKVGIFFSKSNQTVYNLKMGHKIKAIRQKLDAIANVREFHLEERPTDIGVRASKWDDTHSYVSEDEIIGRDGDKENIITRLISDSDIKENVGIIPITGIGGLGKTTLAQCIFNDWKVDEHFQLKMWVCVSETFDDLDSEKSWCLFKQVAFENGQEPVNSREVEVGREIVEKCSGVPFVIKTMGRLLAMENSEAEWVSFKNKKLPRIKERKILNIPGLHPLCVLVAYVATKSNNAVFSLEDN